MKLRQQFRTNRQAQKIFKASDIDCIDELLASTSQADESIFTELSAGRQCLKNIRELNAIF